MKVCYLKPTLSVTAIIIAGKQGEVAAVGGLLVQDELGVEGALTQADVHSHSLQWPESIHIILHVTQAVMRLVMHPSWVPPMLAVLDNLVSTLT